MSHIKITPNPTIIDNSIAYYEKTAKNNAIHAILSSAFSLPIFGLIITIMAKETFDIRVTLVLLVTGLVLGAILAFVWRSTLLKKGELTNTIAKNTYIVLEDDCIRGAALQPIITLNGQKMELNRSSIAGLVKLEEFNISYKQVIDLETFSIGTGDLSYGRCFSIHTARASYSFVGMNEKDITTIQEIIRSKTE